MRHDLVSNLIESVKNPPPQRILKDLEESIRKSMISTVMNDRKNPRRSLKDRRSTASRWTTGADPTETTLKMSLKKKRIFLKKLMKFIFSKES